MLRNWFKINFRVIALMLLLLFLLDVALAQVILPHYLQADEAAIIGTDSMPAIKRLPVEDNETLGLWKDHLAGYNGYKIVFLGDSIMYGSGVPDDTETIPSYFAYYLQLLVPQKNAQVYSFSLQGCKPADTLHILNFIIDAQPDLVIYDVNIGWFGSKTEMDHPKLADLSGSYQLSRGQSTDDRKASGSVELENRVSRMVTDHWNLYRYRIFLNYLLFGGPLKEQLGLIIDSPEQKNDAILPSNQEDSFKPWYDKDFSYLAKSEGKLGYCKLDRSNPHWNNYLQIIRTLDKNRIKSVFFTVPRNQVLYRKYDLLDEKVLNEKQDQLLSVARQHEIATFDYTWAVKDRFFVDTVHLSKQGNQAVGQMLVWDIIQADIFK